MTKSNLLKLSIFATGVSGIVAEYVLSTLATYFLGDSVFQWTMIVSIMLFSMGLGSYFSKFISTQLLERFIYAEILLSILTSVSSFLCYYAAAFTPIPGFYIYLCSISVGILIGFEIPLVTRLNEENEELRVNIANVLEKDYFGSLIGGLFFAFVGLPYLGLTYTPFVLGLINFSVAIFLYIKLKKLIPANNRRKITLISTFTALFILTGFFFAKPIILYGEQAKYKDQVVFEEQTSYQKIVMTKWKDDYWLFINGNQQLSTLDEFMYHEPLVHPAMMLSSNPQNALVLGGGDGCAVREILKYPSVKTITIVDLDPKMTDLAINHPVLSKLNKNSLLDKKVTVINQDGFNFLEQTKQFYDVIIADFPDPKSVDLSRLYSKEFYKLCYNQLRPEGIMITQAGSPYYATKAFKSIELTMNFSGFTTIPLHNQILTLGEWGWILASKKKIDLKRKLLSKSLPVETKWLNSEALYLISSFGKALTSDSSKVEINSISSPVLYQYYNTGNWEIY